MNLGSATLALECRLPGENWHTLNVSTYASEEGRREERDRLASFAEAWSRQDVFLGHQFRVVERV